MSAQQIRIEEMLTVLSAAATSLPKTAVRDVRSIVSRLNGILPGTISETKIRTALATRSPLHSLAGRLSYVQYPGAACTAFAIAAAVVDPQQSAARVFLADLAEWLLIPPMVYRQIARETLLGTSEAA